MQNEPTVHITFDGQPMEVPAGISVAAAVLGHAHAGHTCKHPVDGALNALWKSTANRMSNPASSPCGKA